VYNLPPPTPEVLAEYELLDDSVPVAWLENAAVATTEEGARNLNKTYIGEDRMGPANVHNYDPSTAMARALAGPDAHPPLPDGMEAATSDVGISKFCSYAYSANCVLRKAAY
jgi:hypothetical protein